MHFHDFSHQGQGLPSHRWEPGRRGEGDLARAARVVVLTGAGVRTDSRIPDFRGPRGMWTRAPVGERASHIEYYLTDAEVRRRSWQTRAASPAWSARPNAGHSALVNLERSGRLACLVT